MSEKFSGPGGMDAQIERQQIAGGLDKAMVKRRLFDLFEKGLTPENITMEQLAEVFNVAIPKAKEGSKKSADRQKLSMGINTQIRRLYASMNKKETLQHQFKLYNEEKGGKK